MVAAVQPRASVRRLAPALLFPAGAFAVHQLRYWLAFHALASTQLERQGHAYLHSLVPWIVGAAGLAVGSFLRRLARALEGNASLPRQTLSFGALWLLCAAALVAIYIGQETLEGLFASGHPAGLVVPFGYGGWWSVPAALCVGLVLAAALHGARHVLHAVATGRASSGRWRAPARSSLSAARFAPPRLAPVVGGWSDRGPPR